MPMKDATTVTIKTDTWERLDGLKGRGDSFDDVIQRVLDRYEAKEAVVGGDSA